MAGWLSETIQHLEGVYSKCDLNIRKQLLENRERLTDQEKEELKKIRKCENDARFGIISLKEWLGGNPMVINDWENNQNNLQVPSNIRVQDPENYNCSNSSSWTWNIVIQQGWTTCVKK